MTYVLHNNWHLYPIPVTLLQLQLAESIQQGSFCPTHVNGQWGLWTNDPQHNTPRCALHSALVMCVSLSHLYWRRKMDQLLHILLQESIHVSLLVSWRVTQEVTHQLTELATKSGAMLELWEVIHFITCLYGLEQAIPYSEGVGRWTYCAERCSRTDAHLQTSITSGCLREGRHPNTFIVMIVPFAAHSFTTHSKLHTWNTTNELRRKHNTLFFTV